MVPDQRKEPGIPREICDYGLQIQPPVADVKHQHAPLVKELLVQPESFTCHEMDRNRVGAECVYYQQRIRSSRLSCQCQSRVAQHDAGLYFTIREKCEKPHIARDLLDT